ncbi:MAG: hypothetical protein IPL53_24985 [Ignavibacteria bacterium]|nr:hypothetical protein [Ignavibacteria bacterium]
MAAESYAFLGSTGQMQPSEAFDIVHKYSDKQYSWIVHSQQDILPRVLLFYSMTGNGKRHMIHC